MNTAWNIVGKINIFNYYFHVSNQIRFKHKYKYECVIIIKAPELVGF